MVQTDDQRTQRAGLVALARQAAQLGTPAPSGNLAQFEAAKVAAKDWTGTCARCGHARLGTLKELMQACENCGHATSP